MSTDNKMKKNLRKTPGFTALAMLAMHSSLGAHARDQIFVGLISTPFVNRVAMHIERVLLVCCYAISALAYRLNAQRAVFRHDLSHRM